MRSIWTESVTIPQRNALSGNKKADVAVIGAGLAGILTAYYLQKYGKTVVVLEADRIGSGQTSYTTAKITSQHGLIYDRLIRTMGREAAGQYAFANQAAVEEYKRLIERERIKCHFTEKDAWLYALERPERLKREEQAAKELGLPASYETETELPFAVKGGLRFSRQAQFNPLELVKEIAGGLTIYEGTKVLRVKEHQVITSKGVVEADQIVLASHYPFINFPGFYFLRMYQERSYVLEIGPVQPMDGMYLGIDSPGYSLRQEGDRLLLGYGAHRTGKPGKENPYRKMERMAGHFYPGTKVFGRWSAQDCMTLDGVPYIGRFSSLRPYWYAATGFGKWGMTSSMVSARIISGRILGRPMPYERVFSPQRLTPRASSSRLLENGVESVRSLAGGVLPGAVRCPHLGCRLVWNPYEKAWECPCHGSRFDQNGKVKCGPAQVHIPFID